MQLAYSNSHLIHNEVMAMKSLSLPCPSKDHHSSAYRKSNNVSASLPHQSNPTQQIAADCDMPHLEHFYLPPLEPVFPAKKHAHHDIISTSVNQWLLSWMPPATELQKKTRLQTDAGGLASLMYPNTADPEAVALVGKFIAWVQHFDDIADALHMSPEPASNVSSYAQFVRSVARNPDSIIAEEEIGERPERKAFLWLSKELRDSMSPRIYEHHVHATLAFLHAAEREAGERKQHVAPDVATYVANRRQSVMFHEMHITLEYCLGIELSPHIMDMEAMQELHAAAADHIAWANDILSFRKEYYKHDFQNLPSLVYLEQQRLGGGGGFQSAINRVCEMIRERERDFIFYLHQMLLSEVAASTPQLLLYLENLPYLLSGHLEWMYSSGRYLGVDNQDMAKIRHGLVKMDPDRTIFK